MDPHRQRQIASEGGRAAHAQGTAHEFTPEEAREAGARAAKLPARLVPADRARPARRKAEPTSARATAARRSNLTTSRLTDLRSPLKSGRAAQAGRAGPSQRPIQPSGRPADMFPFTAFH